jgi:hypothetical protein
MTMRRVGAATVAVLVVALGACEEQGSPSGGGGSTTGSSTTGGGSGRTLRPQSVAGKADMSGVAMAVKAFQINMERFPTTAEGLAVLVSDEGLESDKDKWQGPYVDSMDLLKDTYGNPLDYERTSDGFVLRSLGADAERGGTGSSADIELRQPG